MRMRGVRTLKVVSKLWLLGRNAVTCGSRRLAVDLAQDCLESFTLPARWIPLARF